ncbi:addiction module toxin RelE [Candidatus Woesearchaeota archaeon]|nr:MAG: addiction module toxin RelE [Candidatus Woesearchaeota archaeon]
MKRKAKTSPDFEKKVSKLRGQELKNLMNKIDEIICSEDINHYKNLKYKLKRFKRAHVNNSYVILFFGDDGTIHFVDYEHHDIIYKLSKRQLEKYEKLFH